MPRRRTRDRLSADRSDIRLAAELEDMRISFDDNALLPLLYGEFDRNLARVEQQLAVSLSSRGNTVAIKGPAGQARVARDALAALYGRLEKGLGVDQGEVDAAIRLAGDAANGAPRRG